MPVRYIEHDILARLLCHQEHSRGHPGNVIRDLDHRPHDLINLFKILTSDNHDGAFVGGVDTQGANVKVEGVKIRGYLNVRERQRCFVAKIQYKASLIIENIL